MVLAKADITLAGEYAQLCQNSENGEHIFGMVKKEYQRTVNQVLDVTGSETLLQENFPLAFSINRRNPYLEPLNQIQVTLLKRIQASQANKNHQKMWLPILLRTINAIATGLRNTG